MGEDVEQRDRNGRTALHLAVEAGAATMVEQLLQLGADVLAQDKRGETALHKAVARRDAPGLQLLVMALHGRSGPQAPTAARRTSNRALDVGDKAGFTPLHLAAALADEDCVKVRRAHVARPRR